MSPLLSEGAVLVKRGSFAVRTIYPKLCPDPGVLSRVVRAVPVFCFFVGLALRAAVAPATDAPQPLSPSESLERVRIPDGFEMSLVASEPLLQDPSGLTFDEWGRLFVCELHGYNIEGHLDVEELNKTGELDRTVRRIRWEFMGGDIAERAAQLQYGVVKLLSDEDGDGVMDRTTVWADDLPPCYGLVPARGGIIAVCAPDIVFLADRDHDGEVDVRETLFTGFRVRTLERGINNPRWGVDNWIYVGGGGEGGTITGPNLDEPVQLGGTDFRIKSDGSAIEPVTGRVGTFGMTLNGMGDRFPSSGGTPVIYTLPIPYAYLQRNSHVPSPRMNHQASPYNRGFRISEPHPWRVRRQLDPAWVKFYGARETNSNYFSGGCSGEYYVGGAFPSQFNDNLFYCEPSLNIVHRSIVERKDNDYFARRAPDEQSSEFLASTDQWFRPMSLRFGPDGALYIVDMYREIIEDYSAIPRFLQQQYGLNRGSDRGRIWRLAPKGLATRPQANSVEFPARMNSDKWVERLADRERWWRQTARRLLVEQDSKAVIRSLSGMVREDLNAAASLGALYALQSLDGIDSRVLRVGLRSRFPEVRVHALRLSEVRLNDPGIRAQVGGMVDDADSRVRLQLALTLGAMDSESAIPGLQRLASEHGTDRWMTAAILSSAVRSAGTLLSGILSEASLPEGASELIRPLMATATATLDSASLVRVLGQIRMQSTVRQVACLEGMLDSLSGIDLKPIRESVHWALVEPLVESDVPAVSELAVQVAVALVGPTDERLAGQFDAASEQALFHGAPEPDRLRGLRVIANAPDSRLASVARSLLVPGEGPVIQEAVLKSLNRITEPKLLDLVAAAWGHLSPQRRLQGLELYFARQDRIPVLIEALNAEVIRPDDLSDRQRERLLSSRPDLLSEAVKERLSMASRSEITEAQLASYRDALKQERHLSRGEQVFRDTCATCHRVNDIGVDVGPSLASITGKPDEALLLDLLDPNAKVDPEYRSYTVLTRSGDTYSGLLAVDAATSMTLREAQGLEHIVLRQDIEQLKSSRLSLMPSNFGELLSPDDVAHLLGFLRHSFTR